MELNKARSVCHAVLGERMIREGEPGVEGRKCNLCTAGRAMTPAVEQLELLFAVDHDVPLRQRGSCVFLSLQRPFMHSLDEQLMPPPKGAIPSHSRATAASLQA